MSSDLAIRIDGLGKAYRISHQEQHITLAEQALARLRRPLHRAPVETFWALSDIDLDVRRGEVLGLIGRNGAGKSTLLKILSRITPPTQGRVDLYGRVGSLLEVGTGFHPELTGRENIFLNGSVLGMRKAEIVRQFEAIVEFAGVERFLDTPVKRYSSGMYVRLAFAVAAHLETEILLVDEVLAVGDQEFQDKCIGKMRDATTAGKTVILVSHNLATIRQLADQCVLLDRGAIVAAGEADVVLDLYRGVASESWTASAKSGIVQRAAELLGVSLARGSTVTCGDPLVFDIEVMVNAEQATRLAIATTFQSLAGPVGTSHDVVALELRGRQRCIARVEVSSDLLAPGHYSVSFYVGAHRERDAPLVDDGADDIIAFDLVPSAETAWILRNWNAGHGSMHLQSDASVRTLARQREK